MGKVALIAGAGVGGWAVGMYAGNWPHRNIHWSIEGKRIPDSDPPRYEHDKRYPQRAFMQNMIMDGVALGGAALSYGLLRHSHPTAAKVGAALGLGAFAGVEFEMKGVLTESDPNDPDHHVDFPAFWPFH